MAMTLDDLRQQFERADEAYHWEQAAILASPGKPANDWRDWRDYELNPDACLAFFQSEAVNKPVLYFELKKVLPVAELISVAHVFIIARDYGLQAAMTYKLSGGNIDPRKP